MIVPCGYFVALPVKSTARLIGHIARGVGRPLHHAHHVWHRAAVHWVEVGCHVAPKVGIALIPIVLGMLPPATVIWPPAQPLPLVGAPPGIAPPIGEAALPSPGHLGEVGLPSPLYLPLGPIGGSSLPELLPPLAGAPSPIFEFESPREVVPAPEPSSAALLGLGLLGLGLALHRRRAI